MLPIFRTTLVGGVLVMLALLAGFAAAPDGTHLARPVLAARGALIELAAHPEWKLFLLQAAYTRAGEIKRLRDLPDTPAVVAVPEAAVAPDSDNVAALPATRDATMPEDITGTIDDPVADIGVDIGEASSNELPIRNQEMEAPVQRPVSIKPVSDAAPKRPARRAKARSKPSVNSSAGPQTAKDFFTALFGNSAAPDAAAFR